MKKLIAIACAALVGMSAFAFEVSAGARGTFVWDLGTTLEGNQATQMKAYKDNITAAGGTWNEGGNIGAGFGVWANLGLFDLGSLTLGVQPEFTMSFNQGYNVSMSQGSNSFTVTYTGTTIDIPVLVTLDVPLNETCALTFGVGPYLSIPMGFDSIMAANGTETKGSDTVTFEAGLNFGLAADAAFGYKLGIGKLVANVRYMLDFSPTKVTAKDKTSGATVPGYDNAEMLTRRALQVGIGYQITF